MAGTMSLSSQELDKLPKDLYWDADVLHQWKGFWYTGEIIQAIQTIHAQFEARFDDVVLASSMKTGTTWLKALCFSIMGGRESKGIDELQVKNPHELVFCLEYAYANHFDLSGVPSPRLLSTHLPYSAFPDSIKNSDCKIVYISRNPKDTLVSSWHFFNNIVRANNQELYPFEKAYNSFCAGVTLCGPYLDHVLEYWLESLKMPNKILFLKYEQLKRDPKGQVKRLASFLGRPFANEEEVDKVIWRSSLERLKNLEVNKTGFLYNPRVAIPNHSFFRLGVVGDWKNYFTTEMKQDLDEITRIKLEGSGLDFEA